MSTAPRMVSCLSLVLAASQAGPLAAQGATATVRVNLPVSNPITRLHASTSGTDFGAVGAADMSAGYSDRNGPILDVKSNRPFAVLISAVALTFDGAPKPSADVQWATVAGGPFTALTTAGALVLSQGVGGVSIQPIFFRILWSLASDPPGDYTLEVSITATAP